MKAGSTAAAATIGAGAASLKQKVQSQQFTKNLFGMFGAKSKESGAAKENEDPAADDKKEADMPDPQSETNKEPAPADGTSNKQ